MEQSPSCEADSHSVNQEVPSLLCNPKSHFCVHQSPPPIPILSQTNIVHIFAPCVPKVYSDIFPSTSRSTEWFSPSGFRAKFCTHFLSLPCVLHGSGEDLYHVQIVTRSLPKGNKINA